MKYAATVAAVANNAKTLFKIFNCLKKTFSGWKLAELKNHYSNMCHHIRTKLSQGFQNVLKFTKINFKIYAFIRGTLSAPKNA